MNAYTLVALAATRKRQQALFARYDPNVSAEAFSGLLNLFDSRPA